MDATPGRVRQLGVVIGSVGVYYGQCSEVCGVNHRFIPVVVERVRARA